MVAVGGGWWWMVVDGGGGGLAESDSVCHCRCYPCCPCHSCGPFSLVDISLSPALPIPGGHSGWLSSLYHRSASYGLLSKKLWLSASKTRTNEIYKAIQQEGSSLDPCTSAYSCLLCNAKVLKMYGRVSAFTLSSCCTKDLGDTGLARPVSAYQPNHSPPAQQWMQCCTMAVPSKPKQATRAASA